MKQMCVRVPPTIAQMDWQPSIRVFRPTLLSDTIEESLKQEMSLLQLLQHMLFWSSAVQSHKSACCVFCVMSEATSVRLPNFTILGEKKVKEPRGVSRRCGKYVKGTLCSILSFFHRENKRR